MAINGTMTLLQTVTVGSGGAASIDFTSIPATYDDLKIVFSGREATTNNFEFAVEINGSSSAIYNWRFLQGNGSSATSDNRSNQTIGNAFVLSSSNSTASTFGNAELYFPNYRSSNNKSISGDTVGENNGTQAFARLVAYLFASTSAITSISLKLSTGNLAQHSTATLYGITRTTVKAIGGMISEDASYIYHTFTSSGTFTPNQSITADMLVVGGGGGAGAFAAGGGGAGGVITFTNQALTATNYTVTIGAGGAKSPGNNTQSGDGVDSTFGALTAGRGGGGGGGGSSANFAGKAGGSGGGGGGINSAGGASNQTGTGATNFYGNAGGGGGSYAGSGGGGGGAAGGNGQPNVAQTGVGGAGITSTFINTLALATNSGVLSSGNYYYAGGGSGWVSAPANGGIGGGGGANNNGNGVASTGGGGGSDSVGNTGNGGSGIVIVRYAK